MIVSTCVRLLHIGAVPYVYRLVFKRADINECELGTDNCEQICEDVEGTFQCNCRQGFSRNSVDISRCDQGFTLNIILEYFQIMV